MNSWMIHRLCNLCITMNYSIHCPLQKFHRASCSGRPATPMFISGISPFPPFQIRWTLRFISMLALCLTKAEQEFCTPGECQMRLQHASTPQILVNEKHSVCCLLEWYCRAAFPILELFWCFRLQPQLFLSTGSWWELESNISKGHRGGHWYPHNSMTTWYRPS